MAAIGLKSQIWDNNLRSVALLAFYPLLLIGMLWVAAALFAGMMQAGDMPALDPVLFAGGVVAAYWPLLVTLVAIWFTVSWFFHGHMIRAASHAHPITRAQEPELYNMLENLCIARGMKMPRLEIIETHARNAFASGISDATYTVTLTRGLLQSLQPDEVEAVIAHELAHIINRDVRLLMVCVIFTGMIGFAAQMMWSNMRMAMFLPRSGGNNRNAGGVIVLYLIVLAVLVMGYLASMVARFALSRAREYMADAGAVEMTKNPEAMMRALLRISGRDRIPEAGADVALMCIENSAPFLGLFATHPPIDVRVRAISQITNTPVPDLTAHQPAPYAERFQRPDAKVNPWLTRGRMGRH